MPGRAGQRARGSPGTREDPVTTAPRTAGFSASPARHLVGIPEIRSFFRTNSQPIYFVGPTAFNLLGIDRWVRNFSYIAYYDSWAGHHPRGFAPENRPQAQSAPTPQRNNYTLRD